MKRFCIIAGLLCIGAALALCIYNIWDGIRADKAAQAVVSELSKIIPDNTDEMGTEADEILPSFDIDLLKGLDMPTCMIDGQEYIGTLSVPSLDLMLPVMSDWDYDKLKISPCRYSGSAYDDNLVIAGHNYPRHFSRLKWLSTGTEILFTDVDGNIFHYTLTLIETLSPDAVEAMTEDSDDWDLTLFTCTTGGGSRCTLRCVRTDPPK